MACPLLQASPEVRAIYLNVRAEPYLATLLGGANSATDLRGHGPGRMRRLQQRIPAPPAPLHGLSIGELAALSWLVETMSQQEAAKRFPERVLALDFDELLADVAAGMERVLAHFGLPRDARYFAGIARSPVLQRYSKAPEVPFPPGERSARLQDSRRQNRDEIQKGMDWLMKQAQADGAVAAVLATAGVP
jgi:hypothetical protein